jgi:hypothetical protein
MKTSSTPTFKVHPWSDSWLLHAVIHASSNHPSDLAKLIAVGDHYNHAVFTHDELYGGLDRLVSQGWVIKQNNLFSASRLTLETYAPLQERKLSCHLEMKELESVLNSALVH